MTDEFKRIAADAIDSRRGELIALSQNIHDHPELAYQETQSSASLVEACRQMGWQANAGIYELPTAWEATLPSRASRPTVAFLSEFDALPEIGHACGHNLIAVAPLGALIGVEAVSDNLQGQAKIIGTPAEEGGGGKALMGERGAFRDVDAALMVHPFAHSYVQAPGLACEQFDVEFHGHPAHAAANPERGVNALNALIASFNLVDALRQHIRETARVHGIIQHGGDAPNVVPDYTKGTFMVRATENGYLDELMDKVRKCFEAAALATGCTFEIKPVSPRYETVLSNQTLSELYWNAMQILGRECAMGPARVAVSTDMGNVSWRVPSIHPWIKIVDDIPNHTREFAAAAATDRGYEAMIDAAKAMAFTAIDLLSQPELLERARREFEQATAGGRAG